MSIHSGSKKLIIWFTLWYTNKCVEKLLIVSFTTRYEEYQVLNTPKILVT
jgi:hypothetical protein